MRLIRRQCGYFGSERRRWFDLDEDGAVTDSITLEDVISDDGITDSCLDDALVDEFEVDLLFV